MLAGVCPECGHPVTADDGIGEAERLYECPDCGHPVEGLRREFTTCQTCGEEFPFVVEDYYDHIEPPDFCAQCARKAFDRWMEELEIRRMEDMYFGEESLASDFLDEQVEEAMHD